VSSADILDTAQSGGEMAVRLAIGEAQVVGENRDYFAQHGVDLDALESAHSSNKAGARSTTTLLVKNLPPSTVPEELESMFARFGSVAGACPGALVCQPC
jgi:multiple RNA-binding domain-containing protein 1